MTYYLPVLDIVSCKKKKKRRRKRKSEIFRVMRFDLNLERVKEGEKKKKKEEEKQRSGDKVRIYKEDSYWKGVRWPSVCVCGGFREKFPGPV